MHFLNVFLASTSMKSYLSGNFFLAYSFSAFFPSSTLNVSLIDTMVHFYGDNEFDLSDLTAMITLMKIHIYTAGQHVATIE